MSRKRKRAVAASVAVGTLALGGAAIAGATGDDDATERPITGQALERASAAALEHAGGGTVTGTEAGDEEGAYEVEVTRAGGGQVDVHLDAGFEVISEVEDEERGDD